MVNAWNEHLRVGNYLELVLFWVALQTLMMDNTLLWLLLVALMEPLLSLLMPFHVVGLLQSLIKRISLSWLLDLGQNHCLKVDEPSTNAKKRVICVLKCSVECEGSYVK